MKSQVFITYVPLGYFNPYDGGGDVVSDDINAETFDDIDDGDDDVDYRFPWQPDATMRFFWKHSYELAFHGILQLYDQYGAAATGYVSIQLIQSASAEVDASFLFTASDEAAAAVAAFSTRSSSSSTSRRSNAGSIPF